jgi:hypothetical protein
MGAADRSFHRRIDRVGLSDVCCRHLLKVVQGPKTRSRLDSASLKFNGGFDITRLARRAQVGMVAVSSRPSEILNAECEVGFGIGSRFVPNSADRTFFGGRRDCASNGSSGS